MLLMISQLMTLCMPIMVLILPFVLLRTSGVEITTGSYVKILLTCVKRLPIGRLFNMDLSNMKNVVYCLVSICMYVFQLHQNTKMFLSFGKKSFDVLDELNIVKRFVDKSIELGTSFIHISDKLDTMKPFNDTIISKLALLQNYKERLQNIPESSYGILKQFGKQRTEYYLLYKDKELNALLKYMCDFRGYLSNIMQIKICVASGEITKTRYDGKITEFKKMVHPAIEGKQVPNDVKMNTNKIITGVNASGKTTLIKTAMINVLLSQQIGYGYFKSGTVKVYDMLHCYLNIPDTSGRDSLFQAEARRCKNILDEVNADANKSHFCIFDELYSGTNPYEASMAGYAYMKYMTKKHNVQFLLTTHYLDMCEHLNKCKSLTNYHMECYYEGREMRYTYKKKLGITKIRGGVEILKRLEYPESIIKCAENIATKS